MKPVKLMVLCSRRIVPAFISQGKLYIPYSRQSGPGVGVTGPFSIRDPRFALMGKVQK